MRLVVAMGLVLAGCATRRDLCTEGWRRIELRDYAGAVAVFGRDLEGRQSSASYAGQARALYLLGRLSDADLAYEQAIRLEPGSAQPYIGRSLVQLALGDTTGAILSCDRALEIDGTLAKACYNRGLAHGQVALQEEALADFSRAIELDGQLAAAYNARGLVLARMERLAEAIEDFHAASRIEPLLAVARANCAAANYARGDVRLALFEIDTAIQIDSRRSVFYANRGRIYLDEGDAERAAADFERALSLGEDARVWLLLADAHERLGLAEKARREYEHARQLDTALAEIPAFGPAGLSTAD